MSSSDELKALLRQAISPSRNTNNGNNNSINDDDDLALLLSGNDMDASTSYSAISKGLDAVKTQNSILSSIGNINIHYPITILIYNITIILIISWNKT